MENINIINKIGSGMLGDVYLCSIYTNHYALKIEKIEKKNINYDLSVQEWREIEFSQSFANNYVEQFITLCDYDIVEDTQERICHHNTNKFSQKMIERLKNKSVSKYAIRRLYSLVDDNLKNVIDNFTKKQLYSTIAQVAYICYLMQSNGYSHNDFHTKNIGVIHVSNDTYINISNKKLQTHGIHIKALDFGIVLHEKYGLTETEKIIHNYDLINDINKFLIRLITFEKINTGKNKVVTKIFNWNDKPDIFNEFIISREYNLLEYFAVNKYDKFYLFQLLCPEKFQKMLLGENYVQLSKPITRIDLCDLLFIFKNKLNLKLIIKYFIKLANN